MSSTTTEKQRSTGAEVKTSRGKNNVRRYHSYADLHPKSWAAWVARQMRRDESGATRIGGRRVSESDTRSLHRWRVEGAACSFFSGDEFCVRYSLRIDDYLSWCRANKCRAWAVSKPWFELPMTTEEWEQLCRDWPLPEGVEEDAAPPRQLDLAA